MGFGERMRPAIEVFGVVSSAFSSFYHGRLGSGSKAH